MKASLTYLVTLLACGAFASPSPDTSEPGHLFGRGECNRPGLCSWASPGQCEYHCDGYGGFERMQGCGWWRKRCCCVHPTPDKYKSNDDKEEEEEEEKEKDKRLRKFHLDLDERPYDGRPDYHGHP